MDARKTRFSLLAALHGHPFALTEPALWVIATIASREVISADLLAEYQRSDALRPPSAFMRSPGQKVADGSRLRVREKGVGVLPIRGPMIRHADLFDEISGATSMARIAQEIGLALQTPEIKSMVLDMESPGGEMPGDLVDVIREANGVKPVTAYVGNWGMSAAYWSATGAGRLVAHRTAQTGSVGVRATFVNTKKMEEAMGIEVIEMMADESPDKIADPTTEHGRALIQNLLNEAARDFQTDVARNRNVSLKKVREDFGKGAAVHAPRAAEAGMIDALDTMEGVIASVGGGRSYKSTRSAVGSPGVQTMGRTWKEFWAGLGFKPDDPMPGFDSEVTPMVDNVHHAATASDDSDDPAELRRRLKASEEARIAAEKRAESQASDRQRESVATQERDIKAQVKAWVGKKIHPAETQAIEESLLGLARADRINGTAFYAQVAQAIEARPVLRVLDEVVVSGKMPRGGNVVDPPVAPETPEGGDPWKADRERMLAQTGDPASNGHAK